MTTPYGNAPAGPPAAEPPPSNLVWGILTTVLCCIPLGVVSIVYAAQVNGKWASGDVAGAEDASDKAKKWAIAAAVLGLVWYVLVIFFWGAIISMLGVEDPTV